MKQFFYKNILLPSTIVEERVDSPENITKIVLSSLPTQVPIVRTVIVEKQVPVYMVVTATPQPTLKGRYSWYYPPLGGINCDRNADGTEECDFLANGDRWQNWYERGAACPGEWPLGTRFKIIELGLELTCVDRGGAIVKDVDGYFWIDHLTNSPRLYWSSPITIQLIQE